MNLYDFLKSNEFNGLSLNLIKRFSVQILNALVVLQEVKIIHCDLKPENILLRQPNRSAIEIIDFGASCFFDKRIYTDIQSRFYRAPEIMLGIPYTNAIDMWSFGCILAELFTGFPIFPGENEADQLLSIMEYTGVPSKEILMKSSRKKLFFDTENVPRIVPNSKGRKKYPGTKRFQDFFRNADPKFVWLVEACFCLDPAVRITPQQALNCEWILDKGGNKEPTPKNNEKKQVVRKQNYPKSFMFA